MGQVLCLGVDYWFHKDVDPPSIKNGSNEESSDVVLKTDVLKNVKHGRKKNINCTIMLTVVVMN